jgi:hypothetical protein
LNISSLVIKENIISTSKLYFYYNNVNKTNNIISYEILYFHIIIHDTITFVILFFKYHYARLYEYNKILSKAILTLKYIFWSNFFSMVYNFQFSIIRHLKNKWTGLKLKYICFIGTYVCICEFIILITTKHSVIVLDHN